MDRAGRRLLAQQWYREIREGVDRQFGLTREPSVMRPGYELLSPSEQKDVESLRGAATDFAQFYERNRIYFTHEACLLIDQFHSLSSYFASNYESIAFKDKEGRPYVNPEVKRVWDGAVAKIPELKDLLDREFRGLLGVTSVNKKPEATRTE